MTLLSLADLCAAVWGWPPEVAAAVCDTWQDLNKGSAMDKQIAALRALVLRSQEVHRGFAYDHTCMGIISSRGVCTVCKGPRTGGRMYRITNWRKFGAFRRQLRRDFTAGTGPFAGELSQLRDAPRVGGKPRARGQVRRTLPINVLLAQPYYTDMNAAISEMHPSMARQTHLYLASQLEDTEPHLAAMHVAEAARIAAEQESE